MSGCNTREENAAELAAEAEALERRRKAWARVRADQSPCKGAAVMNTQETFTELLQRAVESRGFDFSVDLAYGNCGTFRARRAGTLVELVAVNFDFQKSSFPNYASFTIHSDKPGQQPEQLHYVKFPELQAALDKILSHLPAPKMRRRRRS